MEQSMTKSAVASLYFWSCFWPFFGRATSVRTESRVSAYDVWLEVCLLEKDVSVFNSVRSS